MRIAFGATARRSVPAICIMVLSLSAAVLASDRPGRTDLDDKTRARVERVTKPATDFSKPESFELMQGGAGTSKKLVNQDAFSQFSANMSFEDESDFKLGNALFRKLWVSSPSSTQASDGLGPLFNARACQSCHLKDGRGHPPEGAKDATSMFLRLVREPASETEKAALAAGTVLTLPDPVYGRQLQDLAVPGIRAEGEMAVSYAEIPFAFPDGSAASLRKPAYSVAKLAYGPLDPRTTLSPRISPPMIGLGLVEQIHPADILARADPDDADGDGISGRALLLGTKEDGEPILGRFGWKGTVASIRQQSAEAFAGDIGISTPDMPLHAGDCTQSQPECLAMPNGVQPRLGETEAPPPVLDLVTFYSQNLALPVRRDIDDAEVLEGKRHFYEIGCISCHTPKFVTRKDAPYKPHAFQLIWPYSDFLLHDMGDGLADERKDENALASEWRTPPLWGIGLTKTVNDHTFFLHDGRARNLEEAILWHGGEGAAARDAYAALAARERAALIRFLESL
jgi:CxxC motif-containing protein (DUF1111 family)